MYNYPFEGLQIFSKREFFQTLWNSFLGPDRKDGSLLGGQRLGLPVFRLPIQAPAGTTAVQLRPEGLLSGDL